MTNKWTALSVTTVGVFMVYLDTRITIIGIPQIAEALKADAEQAIWLTQAYQLMITVSLLVIGRISDLLGRAKLYTAGFAIFTLGSALTSLGQDPFQVIMFRAVQGLGGSIIISTSTALITDASSREELGFALGINQMAVRAGTAAGLIVSGVILSFFDWRALFYVNIPIGLFGTVWAHRRLKELSKRESGAKMDWPGFISFTTAITALLLAMTFAAYGLQEQTNSVLLAMVAVVCFAVFIFHERRVRFPLLDLSLFRIKEVAGGLPALLLYATSFGGVIIVVSFYLQLVRNMTPLSAGLTIVPFELAFLVAAPVTGRLSDKYGPQRFTVSAIVVMGAAYFLLSTVSGSTPIPVIELYLVILGIGLATFSSPNTTSIMNRIPPIRRGVVSAMRFTFFNFGYCLGLNALVLIMTLTVPYSIVTSVVSTGGAHLSPADIASFARGTTSVFFWFGLIDLAALVPLALIAIKRDSAKTETSAAEPRILPEEGVRPD
jgi:EmrB/QacA subfamily drug resistance transporter